MSDSEKNLLLLQWLRLCIRKESLAEKLYSTGCRKVAICGFREYGRLLYEELRKEGVEITCMIEKNYQSLQTIDGSLGIPIVGFSNELNCNGTEVILVTPDLDIGQVRECLELAEIKVPMMSMESLLF